MLHDHNRQTYDDIVALFEKSSRVAAVQPTGTGKSYLIMQLVKENPRADLLSARRQTTFSRSSQMLHTCTASALTT